jgi:hypothetical protein
MIRLPLVQRLREVCPVLSKSIPGFVDGDLDQACAEFRLPAKSLDITERFQDRLLRNFFSLRQVRQHRPGYRKHRTQVGLYKTPVSFSVSPAHLMNQCHLVVLHVPPRSR